MMGSPSLQKLKNKERNKFKEMGRSPCCFKEGLNRGAWTAMEDQILTSYIQVHGEGKWRNLPKRAGLMRCGKSCRLRWLNYLRPDIKRGNISRDEEELIIRLHKLLGNRWSLIAGRLPGRTDNEIKNYWNTTLSKKAKSQSQSPKVMSPATKSTEAPKSPQAEANDNNIQVIRTKATRCTKALVRSTHLPYMDDQVDTINSTPSDKLEPQDHESYLIDNLRDQDLKAVHGSAGVNKMNGTNDSDLLNFDCCNEFEASNFDAKVDSAAAGYNNKIYIDTDKSLLPFNEVPIIDCWNTACFDDNATVNLDSLAFMLDSEEWP